ncbi:MAG TPA: GH92 family glycosyl hydrolase [Mycobacteriales bacterium]|nr:GH92 family glycosyl hydrolase [Mycobacteriales bacterium]
MRRGVVAAVFAAALAVAVPASSAANVMGTAQRRPVSAASPDVPALVRMVDTRSGSLGPGFVTVAAGLPFGMVTPGPATTTPLGDDPLDYVGYAYQDPEIRGFALTHFSGAGIHIGGELPVMPTTGPVTSRNPASWASPFTHATETAQPGYYATTLLRSGVRAELTATLRTAVERFTFPAGSVANLIFDVTRHNDSNQDGGTQTGTFRITGDDRVAGSVLVPDSGGVSIYFAARFDRPFTRSGSWTAQGITAGKRSVAGRGAGGWVSFGTAASRQVQADIALSYTSAAEAARNLTAATVVNRGFDAVRAAAQRVWERRLSSISVRGGTRRQRRTFETAMYHASLMPTTFDDADGHYRGFDGRVHEVAPGHHHYTDLSLWDTYRTQTPLLTLDAPRVAHDLGLSLLADTAQNGGVIPRWVRGNRDYGIMGGDSGTPTLATLVTSGALAGEAAHAAYRDVVRQATTLPPVDPRSGLDSYLALGYVPLNVSDRGAAVTLEYAIDDASVAALARRFGDAARTAQFDRRAEYWRHLFDPADRFLRPRTGTGSWATPTFVGLANVWNPIFPQGWQEGTGWQYLWLVPQDVRGLAEAIGPARTRQRLDSFFSAALDHRVAPVVPEVQAESSVFGAIYVGNQYTPANETDLQAPWLYDWLGEPWRTTQVVHSETAVFTPGPYGLPGNDDAGTMSADYVLSAIGLYQAQPGVDAWELSAPMFDTVQIGPRLRISAPGTDGLTPYVAALRRNGHAVNRTWLTDRQLHGTLSYTMTATHGAWGTAASAAPPSLTEARSGGATR